MASSPDRSNLKNWLPGAAGILILFALVGYAGISQGQRETNAAAPTAAADPVAQAKSEVSAAIAAKEQPKPAPAPAPQQAAKAAAPAPATKAEPAAPAAKAAAPVQTAAVATAPAAPAAASADKAAAPKPAAQSHGHDMAAMQKMAQAAPAAPKAAAAPATAGVEGDVTHGRQVFKKCQACHSMEPGKNLLGPSLAGIVGTKAGEVPNYTFSTAMKQSGITWTPEKLDAYLLDPQKVVPGNKMPFPGLKTDADRTDVIAFLAGSASAGAAAPAAAAPAAQAAAPAPAATPPAAQAPARPVTAYLSDAKYTLRSGIAEGRMVFLGVGGTIDGKVNPILTAVEGQVVQVTLINGEGTEHDIVFPDQDARSPRVINKGASTSIVFRAGKAGDFLYYCDVPGHRLAGMEGQFLVTATPSAQVTVEADISRPPTDLPPPIGKRDPKTVRLDLLTVEMEGRLAEGTTFGYWTFNGKVPGPFVRVRVGDTVDVHLKNAAESNMIHSVDFHAATGPGGGAAALQVDPGKEKSMSFKALKPGLYVYHCATPMVAEHIANGMYGLILVEPEEGLPPVDHEFYVMQGEIYTDAPYGQRGSQEFSVEKLLAEKPEYFVFNGSVGAITKLHPLHAKVGETVRLYFGVGGPNFTSSFHVIGEIFDKVYNLGGVMTPPLEGIQTVTVPPGGAVITEFKLDVPGGYTIVDHALSRAERGLAGMLVVEGEPNPDIYNGVVEHGMGH
ncbi:MAG: nitrite reductase, copper-containing [Rhizobiales bacterium 62-47]|nr:nitrite reductase, copper-containing [Hyphomicrobiales bacterium]OJY11156.1 MAG: nitrite reductase, copper-containing [Rhizobiales bacterium 62-47]